VITGRGRQLPGLAALDIDYEYLAWPIECPALAVEARGDCRDSPRLAAVEIFLGVRAVRYADAVGDVAAVGRPGALFDRLLVARQRPDFAACEGQQAELRRDVAC
jgi:hypothetical protein